MKQCFSSYPPPPQTPQKGNALFLILIAVALFAALSYAVTQSGRGGGNASSEQAEIKAARLMQYAASVDQAVQRLMLTGGCTESQLSFDPTPGVGGEYNPLAPSDLSCHVFAQQGGGVPVPDEQYGSGQGWGTSSLTTFKGVGRYDDGLGASCPGCELALVYQFSAANAAETDSVCKALNRKLIGQAVIPLYTWATIHFYDYDGDFLEEEYLKGTVNVTVNGVASAILDGQYSFCLRDNSGKTALFHTLLAR